MSKKYNAVANAEQSVSSTFVKGAAILTVSMIIVKVFGLLDKVILADIYSMFGDSLASMGVGIYNNAYEVFVVIFTVATGGLPIVISRLISENMTQKRYKDVKLVHRISIPLFAIVGLVCMLAMVAVSFPYAFYFIKSPYAIYAMIALAPVILFGCLTSIYRGYYEGQRNMFPTAVSEVIEAVVKLVLGALFAFLIMKFGMEHYRATGRFLFINFGNNHIDAENTILAFSVAGNICGISIASFCSFLYLVLKYKIGGDGIPAEYLENSVDARQKRETFAIIVKTALPIVGGALVMSIGSLIDAVIIQNVLFNLAGTNAKALFEQYKAYYSPEVFFGGKGNAFTIHTRLWGCYGASLTLMQLVTAVTQVFGSSAMPNVTSAYTKGNKAELKTSIETVLKMTMMFTLPMALGLGYELYLRKPRPYQHRRQRAHPNGNHNYFYGNHHPDLQYAQRYRQGKAAYDSVHHLYARKDRNLLDICKYARNQHSGCDGRLADLLCSYLRGRNVPARQALGDRS